MSASDPYEPASTPAPELPAEILSLLRCPDCGAALDGSRPPLACLGSPRHTFQVEQGFLTFGEPPLGKYGDGYAARYAALWAFGYQTLHLGLDESLYRTVAALAAECLAARPAGAPPPVVVDCGCGVGRVAADLAALAPGGVVLALDGSPAMLALAARIVRGREPVEVDSSRDGFGTLAIPARGRENVHFLRADVLRLPVAGGVADLALSVNIVDRLPGGPAAAFAECHRILRPGGRLIFTDPLNFEDADLWARYGSQEAVRALLEATGFAIETWFDQLPYREIVDRRGSHEEFNTLVVLARKSG